MCDERENDELVQKSFAEKLNSVRGFTEDELNACVKVLEKIAPRSARRRSRRHRQHAPEKEEEEKKKTKVRNDEEEEEERYYDEETLEERRGEGVATPASSFKTVLELKQHKRLRTSLLPLVEYFTAKLYRGQDPAEYREQIQSKRAKNDRNQRMRALDREAVAKTKLREERLRKLRQLEETNFNTSSEAELLDWKKETEGGKRRIGNGTGGVDGDDDTRDALEEEQRKQQQLSGMLVPDGVVEEEEGKEKNEQTGPQKTLHTPNACYCCKKRFTDVHHFYASMCPSCA